MPAAYAGEDIQERNHFASLTTNEAANDPAKQVAKTLIAIEVKRITPRIGLALRSLFAKDGGADTGRVPPRRVKLGALQLPDTGLRP